MIFSIVFTLLLKIWFQLSNAEDLITRVPDHCSDVKAVKIDEIILKSHKYYVIYGNYSLYVEVEGLTGQHLPIVRLDSQPKPFDNKIREQLRNSSVIIEYYIFNEYTYGFKNQSDTYFIGFNYLWLGCPQPLCLSGGIDAATKLTNGSTYAFRGNYYWDLLNPPLVSNAMRITQWKGNYTEDSEFDLGHFNAVVTNRDFTSFYSKEHQYVWANQSLQNETFILQSSEFQYGLDAAFHIRNGNDSQTYYIKGNKYLMESNPFDLHFTNFLGISLDRVDSAFGQNQTIYATKDSFYIKLVANTPIPIESQLVFKDLYHCPSDLYDKFGGYDAFIENFFINGFTNEIFNKEKDVKTSEDEKQFEQKITIFVVILVFIIVLCFISIVLRKRSKKRYRNHTILALK